MADIASSEELPTMPSSRPLPSSSLIHNNPSETGYDPTLRWRNYFNVLAGRMTPRGQLAMREDAYIRNEAQDIARCEEWRNWLFTYSPTIIFLRQQIRHLNGELDEENVICRRCPTRIDEEGRVRRQGGGFSAGHGILICANEMRSRSHLEDTLAHEMVHAWDSLRWKVKEGDLRHAACTEIRASTLSGECRWTREFFTRGNWNLTQQHQNCVRSRAVQSVMNRPNCRDDVQAVKVVNEVWDSCYNDTRPFDEIYR